MGCQILRDYARDPSELAGSEITINDADSANPRSAVAILLPRRQAFRVGLAAASVR
jgi:hypothetical protein